MTASARPARASLRLGPVLVAGLAVLAACGSQAGSSTASSSKPVRGGQLTVAIDAQPTGFDPVTAVDPTPGSASVSNEIFATLTAPTASGAYAPYLAASVTGNSDDSVWTITLRPSLKFADGTPIDAAAVQYNLARVEAAGGGFTEVKSYKVTSPLTLVATMKAPWSAFPAALSGQEGWIASPTALKAEGKGFATKPVGSGPYELQNWSQGNQFLVYFNTGVAPEQPDGPPGGHRGDRPLGADQERVAQRRRRGEQPDPVDQPLLHAGQRGPWTAPNARTPSPASAPGSLSVLRSGHQPPAVPGRCRPPAGPRHRPGQLRRIRGAQTQPARTAPAG